MAGQICSFNGVYQFIMARKNAAGVGQDDLSGFSEN